MAEMKLDDNLGLVHTLVVQPGIKRDGTQFEAREFTDGAWLRFQRGVAKKAGGYRQIFRDSNGTPRGMISNAYNALNYLFIGNENTLDAFTTGTNFGVGSGPYRCNMYQGYSKFTLVSQATPSFVVAGDRTAVFTAGTKITFNQTPGSTIYEVLSSSYSSPNTTVTLTTAFAGTPTDVWLADYYYQADADNLWQMDIQYNPQGGALQVIAHPGHNLSNIDSGVPTQVYAGNILPSGGNQWDFYGLADSEGANPTYRPIVVDGGVCVLYPFIFVYGSNGFIANNHVDTTYADQNFNDWNGALANQVNMAAGKIVKGIPVRGGTQSPSGLFWATDSLIRVSFTGDPNQYWRYDILSSQTSIMSSNSVVEMDGIYYWMGVDRFYKYNGTVSVVPNDKNVNWLFDNLNYVQRQKVWATKVPRYNEIWFFYPRGTATECTDAIIYNVKDNLWYDAGSAPGARRSCGYTTEVFPTPIWCGWEYSNTIGQAYPIIATPAGEPAPNDDQVYISGDVTTTFVPGKNLQLNSNPTAPFYEIVSSSYNSVKNFTLITVNKDFVPVPSVGQSVYPVSNGRTIWQQEFGLNQISDDGTLAIESYATTCDISWVGGNPSGDTPQGVNRRMHIRRIEPDFLQTGDMSVQVIGRKFARGEESFSPVFNFGPDDGKVDMRIENREARLKFISNSLNGNYEMGRILITAEYGDERP